MHVLHCLLLSWQLDEAAIIHSGNLSYNIFFICCLPFSVVHLLFLGLPPTGNFISGVAWGPQTKTSVFPCPTRPYRLRILLCCSEPWISFQPLGSIPMSQIHSSISSLRAFAHVVFPPWTTFSSLSYSQHLMSTHFFLILIQCFIF